MLSLILSVRQLRQPSGPTELSRFGSRDLGPAANQHSRVLSTSMPNQIQSGDPINQAPFICKAPRNQGSLLSDSPDVCTKSASAAGAGDMFEIEMHCDSPSSSVAQREEREREREKSIISFKRGFKCRLRRCQDCASDLRPSHSAEGIKHHHLTSSEEM